MYFFFHAAGVSSFIGERGGRDERMYFFFHPRVSFFIGAQLAQQFDEDGGAGGGGGGGGTLHRIREGMAQPADLPVRAPACGAARGPVLIPFPVPLCVRAQVRLDLFLPSAGAVQGGRGGRQLRGPARTISLEADRTLERMHQY